MNGRPALDLPSGARSIRYYDSIAGEYDAQMERASCNRWIRDAFRDFVARAVPPPASVLDFGCGTGSDTAWLAERGYRVFAHDSSPGMLEMLRSRCARSIERGAVCIVPGSLPELTSALDRHPPLDAVISNFAVFNLIPDLRPIFRALAPRVTPGGRIFLSLSNPLFWEDLLRPALWGAWARSFGGPAIHLAGRETELYRHWVRSVRRAAEPHFTLSGRASVGALVRRASGPRAWHEPGTLAEIIESRSWTTFPMTRLGQFFFLGFRRKS